MRRRRPIRGWSTRWLVGAALALPLIGAAAYRPPSRIAKRVARASILLRATVANPAPPRIDVWPMAEAPLALVPLPARERARPLRVLLDPGHGAADNPGNRSCTGADEQDVMLPLARLVAARLEATHRFEVRLARDGALVAYADRVADAAAWEADAFVSLHSDVRGTVDAVDANLAGARPARCSREAAGFAVLVSDEGEPGLVAARLDLARAAARRMREAGFSPYGGAEYVSLYEGDADPGVFLDRHAPGQRIFLLRKPTMPAILVETHNALHPDEIARWAEDRTVDAFASAVAAALLDALP